MDLKPGKLTLPQLADFARRPQPIALDKASRKALDAGAKAVAAIVRAGKLAQTHIPDDQLDLLQRNLVLSHSVGVGAPLADDVVRLAMLLKVASLARGFSGVRPLVVDAMLKLLAAEVYPLIPSKGSV
jgi:histidine ammonia-lyase